MIWYFAVLGLAFDLITPGASRLFTRDLPLDEVWLALGLNTVAALLASGLACKLRNAVAVAPICGVLIGVVGYGYILFDEIGIITVVWHGGFGTFLFGAMLTHSIYTSIEASIAARIEVGMGEQPGRLERFRSELPGLRTDLWGVLKILIQGVLGLAAITGVTMSILFGRGFESVAVKVMAVKMASGFFICGLALYVFVAAPALNLIADCWTLDQGITRRIVGQEATASPESAESVQARGEAGCNKATATAATTEQTRQEQEHDDEA